ncbi:MAG: phage shock protein PspA [Proteobacteria bacterium]|nr:phage shock protein PspA [Pseudomonadota bacterium]MDA1057708.1 phage shock protein PspA [Pseudomonadota bacterium]
MGVFSRLTDIINSNLTAMLDRAEDPEKMIRLIIQEMEDTLVEVRSTAARTIAEKKGINRQLDRLADSASEWERKAEFAISRGRDDLAKGALLEKSKLSDSARALEAELALLDDSLAKNDSDVARLEIKLTEAKAKQKTIRSRKDTVDARLKVRRQLHDPRVDDAFARFEKIEKRIDATEGEIESYDLGQRRSLSDEIAELEAENSIQEELDALKARVASAPKS